LKKSRRGATIRAQGDHRRFNAMKRFVVWVGAALVAIAAAASAQAPTDSTTATPPETASTAVKRAVFCTGVTEREPIDEITTLAAPADKVCFFTEIIGMEGRTVTHRWLHNGQAAGEVPISIGAARWRCYTTKTLAADAAAGTWTVEIVDDAGAKLGEASLTYQAAP
jgi:hypothetical protein